MSEIDKEVADILAAADRRHAADLELARRRAPIFLEAIGIPNFNLEVAADAMVGALHIGPEYPSPSELQAELGDVRAAKKAALEFYGALKRRAWRRVLRRYTQDVAAVIRSLDGHAAERGWLEPPSSVNGPAKFVAFNFSSQLEFLIRATIASEADLEKEIVAHRPRQDWKRELSLYHCFVAHAMREQSGLSDPLPSKRNGIKANLATLMMWENGVERSTAERLVADALALVGRVVKKRSLSTDDLRRVSVVTWHMPKGLHQLNTLLDGLFDDEIESDVGSSDATFTDDDFELRQRLGLLG